MGNANSYYEKLAAIMREKLGELLGAEEMPGVLSAVMACAPYAVYLAMDAKNNNVLFQYIVSHDEDETDALPSINIAFSERENIWMRWIDDDDGFIPDALREAAQTLNMDFRQAQRIEDEARALADIKLLLNMYRGKNGLR